MAFQRRYFGGLSLEVPPGLFEDDEAPAGYAVALTALEPATLRIRTVDPASAVSLSEVMTGLVGASPKEVEATGEDYVWPGLAAEVPGEPRCVHYLFESGGQVIYGMAQAPPALWADYGSFLEGAMLSLDIGGQPLPSLPLFEHASAPEVREKQELPDPAEAVRLRLAEVAGEAATLIEALHFEEAEALIRRIDSDIFGANALARAYEAALERSPAEPRILDRAVYWARGAFPEAHTAVEAEEYRTAAEETVARLKGIARLR